VDSKEMRLRARHLRQQAGATLDITARAALIKTAVTWEKLAKQFEKLVPAEGHRRLRGKRSGRRKRRS